MSDAERAVAAPRYAGVQIFIHWVAALLVIGMVATGFVMTDLGPGQLTNALYEIHKSIGLILVGLIAARLVARAVYGAPEPVPMPGWQHLAAGISHVSLYVLLVVVPISGWAATSSCCPPVNLFWTIDMTLPIGRDMARAQAIFAVHAVSAYLLAFVVLIHAVAALHHHYIGRDATLRRMMPGGDRATLTR